MDNLDEKIQEIIENEVNYNFALSKTGQIVRHKIKPLYNAS